MNLNFSKRSYYITGGFVFLLIIFYFLFWRQEKITNFPSNGTNIVAFGDSLVLGVGASSEENNFVSVLSRKINIPIVNLGVSGDTTSDGLARINELEIYNPKVVIVLFGGNDYLKKVPTDITFSNLEKIIQKIQSKGSIVLLLGIRGGVLNDKYKAEFKRIKNKYHTAYSPDVLKGLLTNEKYMSDPVHPNDMGYFKIAEKIYPTLLKLIK
jgi:lysophospholipase L1-like esterase